MKKLTPLAAFAAVAALALPVAGWADDTTPTQPQVQGARPARILDRIQKVEARIDAATRRIATLRQKLDERCNGTAPQPASPAAGGDQTAAAPSRADRCALAQARLEQAKDRLQKAKDRLATIKAKVRKWLDGHSGQSSAGSVPGLFTADQAALAQLQQQLAGVQS
jgi:hypothetical protein